MPIIAVKSFRTHKGDNSRRTHLYIATVADNHRNTITEKNNLKKLLITKHFVINNNRVPLENYILSLSKMSLHCNFF